MASPLKSWEGPPAPNFRSNSMVNEPTVFGGTTSMVTPAGTVRTQQPPPPLPPRIQSNVAQSSFGGYGSSYGHGLLGGYGMSGYGMGGYGMSGYGMGGYGSYGGMGSYNRFGYGNTQNPLDPETRFIQYAEESSRPAFESIESLVSTIGHIAAMLDSTFFAITSSFRAVLGVAANFGRIRGVIGQVLTTFSLFKWIIWIYRKIMWTLGLSKIDPNSVIFTEAFAAAQGVDGAPPQGPQSPKRTSPWPIISFLGFIIAAPYLIMKLMGTVSTSALEQSKDPKTWVNPIKAQATYSFRASNSYELNLYAGQQITVAPREVQVTQKLINTGWALATVDGINSGLIPINYLAPPQKVEPSIPENYPDFPSVPLETQSNANVSVTSEPMSHSESPVIQLPPINSGKNHSPPTIPEETAAELAAS